MTAPAVRPVHPSRLDVTQEWIEQYLRNLHTAMPARVQSYNAATQVADLVPLVRHPVPQPDGSYVMEDLPVLPSVQVLWPRAGKWFVAGSLAPGDFVLVIFCERAIGAWWAGDGSPQDPEDVGTHDLSYAVCLPVNFWPRSKALAHAPSGTGTPGSLVIGSDDPSGARITIRDDGTMELGGAAAFVALASLVDARVSAIVANLNSHTHSGVTTGSGTSGTSAVPISPQASVASTTAKAG